MRQCFSTLLFCTFVLLLLLALFPPLPAGATDTATLVRVVDGDTKVRLIGVDTPEKYESNKLHRDAARTGQDEQIIRALGTRASDFTKSLGHRGDQVQLEYGQEARDKYHRLLAFVWLSDGRMLNETIVCEGYGNALTRACERQAREQGKGLWGGGLAAASASSPRRCARQARLLWAPFTAIPTARSTTCPRVRIMTDSAQQTS